jgi:HSP20 family protein
MKIKTSPQNKQNTPSPSTEDSSNLDQAEIGQLSVDVYESNTELTIVAPVAGVKLSDINLSITEDVLTLSGKRNLEFQISTDDYLIQECFWGDFSRAIVLPDNIDQTRITASFKDGILKITIPKTSNKNKTKLIRIKSE